MARWWQRSLSLSLCGGGGLSLEVCVLSDCLSGGLSPYHSGMLVCRLLSPPCGWRWGSFSKMVLSLSLWVAVNLSLHHHTTPQHHATPQHHSIAPHSTERHSTPPQHSTTAQHQNTTPQHHSAPQVPSCFSPTFSLKFQYKTVPPILEERDRN